MFLNFIGLLIFFECYLKFFMQELREEEFRTTLKEKEKFIQGLQESLRNLKHEVEKVKILIF